MKRFLTIIISFILILLPFTSCKKSDERIIELNEVTHSVFYAPLYVAIENGYFEEKNIKINLTNGGGADNSMTAVLSGSADIGLMGPETVIYVYNQNKKDCPKVFAQLTQKDGSFLVSRNIDEIFDWNNLKNKEILAGRLGGVPAMTFDYILKEKGFLDDEYTLNYDVQFNMMTSAFLNGTADYCTVFEPTASEYEKQGKWKIVASVGENAGNIPYTSFIAKDSFIKDNQSLLKDFINALKKASEYIQNNSDLDIAKSIIKQFPSTEISSIETSIKSYRKIEAWKYDLTPTEESFNRLQDIMRNAGELENIVDFNKIVNLELS